MTDRNWNELSLGTYLPVRFTQMWLTRTQAHSHHTPCRFPPKSSMVTGQWRNATTGVCVVANVAILRTSLLGRAQTEEEWNI